MEFPAASGSYLSGPHVVSRGKGVQAAFYIFERRMLDKRVGEKKKKENAFEVEEHTS
jgi:hypothetical protein